MSTQKTLSTMKNKNHILILAFVAGLIAGSAIVWALCDYCCKKSCSNGNNIKEDTSAIRKITVKEARQYFLNYLAQPVSLDTLKAFSISDDQFTAMKLIDLGDTSVHGFRIYMGMDDKSPVGIVIGTGSPDRVNIIYATPANNSGPCPKLCDDSSPIMPH